jgi:hypothetical protein
MEAWLSGMTDVIRNMPQVSQCEVTHLWNLRSDYYASKIAEPDETEETINQGESKMESNDDKTLSPETVRVIGESLDAELKKYREQMRETQMDGAAMILGRFIGELNRAIEEFNSVYPA